MSEAKRPNILLITSDQQHWTTLGALNPAIRTPNLDRLAARGTLFERAYCPNPTCTPTRASILTGMYPSQHGAYSLGTKLDEGVPTLGEALQADGYDAALIGKAHFQPLISTEEYPSLESHPKVRDLDFWRDFHGPFYGFNHVELARNHADEAHVGQHYALWMEEKGFSEWPEHFQSRWGKCVYDSGERVGAQFGGWTLPEEFHYNNWIAERTNARIDHCREEGKPFFLWSSFFDPHPPYLVPAPWDTMYDPADMEVPEITPGEHEKNPVHFQMTQTERPDFSAYEEAGGSFCHGLESHLRSRERRAREMAIYYGMVSCMDHYIGKILDHLEATGLAEDTIIVFTSDHGHLFGQHGLVAKGPFHYEDLVKVPFIVSWPGQVPEGKRSEALQSLVDLAPTFLGLAGGSVPGRMTGRDQTSVWTGKAESVRDHAVVENRHQPTTVHVKTYIDRRWKLTVYFERDYGELFDLEADPGEVDNLWSDPAYRETRYELTRKLLFAEMGKEPLPMPRISGA